MKTKILYNLLVLPAFILIINTFHVIGQVTVPNNNTAGGDYVGSQFGASLTDVIFENNGANTMTLSTNGDLNITGVVTGGANGYEIGGNYMLWNAGDITSIYVGGFAGDGITPSSANTFWGYGTGNSTFTGSYNSFGGYLSGVSNVYGDSNVFIGNQCGYNNSSGSVNVYIGNLAGYNSNADSNVFIGDQSGYWNSTGYENTFSPDKI